MVEVCFQGGVIRYEMYLLGLNGTRTAVVYTTKVRLFDIGLPL